MNIRAVIDADKVRIDIEASDIAAEFDRPVMGLFLGFLDIPSRHFRTEGSRKAAAQVSRDQWAGSDPEFALLLLQSTVDYMAEGLNQFTAASLRVDSGFDELSPLDARLEDVDATKTPSTLRGRYSEVYQDFMATGPDSVSVLIGHEIQLHEGPFVEDSKAVRFVGEVFKLSTDESILALSELRDLYWAVFRSERSLDAIDSVAQTVGFVKKTRFSDLTDSNSRRAGFAQIPNTGPVYLANLRQARSVLLEEMSGGLLDTFHIATLQTRFGVYTVADLVTKVNDSGLYNVVGLSRDELRDLYYHVREYHQLNLKTTRLSAVLNISG